MHQLIQFISSLGNKRDQSPFLPKLGGGFVARENITFVHEKNK